MPVLVDEPTEVAAVPPPVEPTVEPTSPPVVATPAKSSSALRPIAPTTPSASAPPGPPTALASAPSSAASARPPLTSAAGVVVSGQTVVASGRSSLKTKSFALATGSYTVAWRGRGKGNCIGDVTSVDGAQDKNFLNVILEAPERGETQVYGIKAGQFYLDMTCDDWAVAIVPQGQDALALLETAPAPTCAVETTSRSTSGRRIRLQRAVRHRSAGLGPGPASSAYGRIPG